MKRILICALLLVFGSLLYAEETYKGYSVDRDLLRDTIEIAIAAPSEKKIKASSEKAIQAAQRLFSNVSFLFKKRSEVIEILGDPATLSDYGIKNQAKEDSDLVYLFDSGFGGAQYTLKFRNGGVWAVS